MALVTAGPAAAHTALVDTTPGDGKRLTAVPDAVSLTFSGGVLKLGAAVKVTGPGGTAEMGAAKLKGKTISFPVAGELANGKYVVSWRVTSADGHPIDGKFDFLLNAPVPEPTTAITVPTSGSSSEPITPPTSHTPDPGMTGPMEGMEGMPGMATQPPSAGEPAGSTTTTALAIAGLVLLTVVVAGAIVIERRRRPRPGAGPSGPASG